MEHAFYKLVAVAGSLLMVGCGSVPIVSPDTNAGITQYRSVPAAAEGQAITIECGSASSLQNADCMLWTDPKYKTSVRFLSLRDNQSYLTRLIKESASKPGPRSGAGADFLISAADSALIRRIAEGKISCFADERMADLIVACPVSELEQKTVILFLRGLCDRCEFEPIPLRAEQRK